MTKQEIQAALDKAKKQLAVAKEADEKAFAEKKIARLEKELAELEKESEKAAEAAAKEDMKKEKGEGKPKKEKAPKEKTEKKTKTKKSHRFPERNKYYVDPSKKVNKIGVFHEVHKVNEETYTFVNTKTDVPKAEFDIVKKKGKWEVQCRTARKTFNTLQGAVTYVARTIYTKDVLPIIKEKEKKIKADKERREERKAAGKPAVKTASETAHDGVKKAVSKVKEKAADDEAVSKDLNSILRSFQEGVGQITAMAKKEKASIDKKLVRSLIADLKKLL